MAYEKREQRRRESDPLTDEQAYWQQWPNAKRYYTPEQIARYQAQWPGWTPHVRDLNGFIHDLQVRRVIEPSPVRRAENRQAVIEAARKVGQP